MAGEDVDVILRQEKGYWYSRFEKKHILVLLASIPVLMFNTAALLVCSFCSGAVATASRTVHDWAFIDNFIEGFEIHPYIHYEFEPGCISWLNFSTCEQVQFAEWVMIMNMPETVTFNVFNLTNYDATAKGKKAGQLDEGTAKPTVKEIAPVSIKETFTDFGSVAPPFYGWLLNMRVKRAAMSDMSRVNEKIITPDAAAIAGLANGGAAGIMYREETLGGLLGAPGKSASMAYYSGVGQQTDQFRQYGTGQVMGLYGLMYYQNVDMTAQECGTDPGCAGGCAFSSTCQPISLTGFSGLLMPSASFFFEDYSKYFLVWNHWPFMYWDYTQYNTTRKFEDEVWDGRPVHVFDPETHGHRIYANSGFAEEGDAVQKAYPDTVFQKWKSFNFARRLNGCSDTAYNELRSTLGKDCGTPSGFLVQVGHKYGNDMMYLSQPHFQEFNRDGSPIKAAGAEGPSWIPAITGVGGEGSALYKTQEPSIIYSEKRSGLRMDYTEKYQLNVRIPKNVWGTLNTYAEDLYYPLFWSERTPVCAGAETTPECWEWTLIKSKTYRFQTYPQYCMEGMAAGLFLYVISLAIALALIFYGFTCVAFMKNAEKLWEPHKPNYLV